MRRLRFGWNEDSLEKRRAGLPILEPEKATFDQPRHGACGFQRDFEILDEKRKSIEKWAC
jgi:hypothetical protein